MELFNRIKDFIVHDYIGEPPWEYDFLVNLPESEYPKYLAKIFNYRTGEKLPLKYDFKKRAWIIDKKKCKTFNQKIQWIKLYGVTDLMRKCTDKVAVRDYVRERIGEEYLKPVLQIIPSPSLKNMHNSPPVEGCLEETGWSYQNYFDQIHWDKLPNSFVIKCNHGCRWQYIIKDKNQFLQNKHLFEIVKRNIIGWLEQEYFPWNGFEMQYRCIEPKIIIESLLREDIRRESETINVYCFNGRAKIFVKYYGSEKMSVWDETFNPIEDIFSSNNKFKTQADKLIIKSKELSEKLSTNNELNSEFNFVRMDWMIYKNKLYFEEMTYTPYSGFRKFDTVKNDEKLGSLMKL